MTFARRITTAVRASSLGMTALFALFTLSPAFAADTIKADVPFQFHVGSRTLPAGAYEFKIDRTSDKVSVANAKGPVAMEMILTSLAARPHATDENHPHIVFDKLGTTYTLSELWEPGSDGVVVHLTKGQHEHHVLHVKP